LDCGREYDHDDKHFMTAGARAYLDLVDRHPDTNFILAMSREYASREIQHKRIQLVSFDSGMTNQQHQYQLLRPESNKNFDSDKTFVCLNRNARQHRVNLVSYLLGRDLETFGHISFRDDKPTDSWLERVSWTLNEQQQCDIKPYLMRGYAKIEDLQQNSLPQVDSLYNLSSFNNATNFDILLRPLYQNYFVEIISETSFNQPHFGASEKFLNSVFGYNFPIMIGGQGVVKWLGDMGFDMFHDIIDHSYDNIQNPLDRLCTAIDANMSLLTDPNKIKLLWQNNKSRFDKNVEFAKNKMYDWFWNRSVDQFQQIHWKQ